MRKSRKSNNPPPLRGREARPQGVRVGGGHAPRLHVKIESFHQDSRIIFERTPRPQSSASGSSYAAARLKAAAFADRCRLAPSLSTSHALNESYLSKSTAGSMPGERCMMPRGLGGWRHVDTGFSECQTPMSCGTSKRYCRISDQHSSVDSPPPPHPASQDAPSPSRGESR